MFSKPKPSRVSVEYTGADANDIIGNGCVGGCAKAIGELIGWALLIGFLLAVMNQ
jgi:hypothetical protein